MMVNETFARNFQDAANAMDHLVTDADGRVRKVIGVVKSVDFMDQFISDVYDIDPNETFVPAESPGGFDSSFVIRVDGRPEDYIPVVRESIQSVDRRVPVFGVMTMQGRLEDAFARPKLYRTALLFFASFALLLAVSGIYAVVSYAVSRRTHETGVRLALRSTPRRLRGAYVGQGLLTVALGTACGVFAAATTGTLLANIVEGARAFDIGTYCVVAVSIWLIAGASLWTATRPIAQLDVMEILRTD